MGRKFVHLQPKHLQQPSDPGAIKSHAKLGLQSVENSLIDTEVQIRVILWATMGK